jgi:hypothetical protein
VKSTVDQAVSDRPVSADILALISWANREVVPFLKQARAGLNARAIFRATCATDGAGTYQRLWTSAALPSDATWTIEAVCAGTASTAGASKHAGYTLAATFASTAGTVSQVGTTTTIAAHESDAGINVRFGVNAADRYVYLEACDDATAAMSFVAVVYVAEAVL